MKKKLRTLDDDDDNDTEDDEDDEGKTGNLFGTNDDVNEIEDEDFDASLGVSRLSGFRGLESVLGW